MAGPILLRPEPRTTALALLSLPAAELRERISDALERNPLLVALEERAGADEGTGEPPDADIPILEWMSDLGRPSFRTPGHSQQEAHEGYLRSLPDRPAPLHERLHRQFILLEDDPWRLWIGEQIIFNLDERGWLADDLERLVASMNAAIAAKARGLLSAVRGRQRRAALAVVPPQIEPEARLARALLARMSDDGSLATPLVQILDRMEVRPKEAEDVLRAVQSLEPAGVGARDLRECLLLQLADRPAPPLARRLVEAHLPDVEAGDLQRIATRLKVPIGRVRAAARAIRALGHAPHPASTLVEPDAALERAGDGWRARLLRAGVPRLSVSRHYARRAKAGGDTEEGRFLAENLREAGELVQALAERDRILLLLCDEVASAQGAFLRRGPSALAPASMKDVARRLRLPLATLSRALEGKSVATPYGVMRLRAFFASGGRGTRRRKK